MKVWQSYQALRHVTQTIARFSLEDELPLFFKRKIKRYLRIMHPLTKRINLKEQSPERIKTALEEMGPLFVKFGQILSTRRDLLSEDLFSVLARLRDQVTPFSGTLARKIVDQALPGAFLHFDETPLASASIAQVHLATTQQKEEVVIKILRPDVLVEAQKNLDALRVIAIFLTRWMPETRRLNLTAIIEELAATLYDELDLLKEAANASQLKRNFQHSDLLYVPHIHWAYCRHHILVMERIQGVSFNDIHFLKSQGVNLQRLAENGVTIFYTQVFSHSFFHADMHPGNLFVDIKNPDYPRYMAIDFGIMGSLNREDQYYLACNFLAFFRRDYRHVAELHIRSGWVHPSTRVERLETAIRAVCEPIFEKPLKDISFGHTLLRLFQTARQFDMEIQPQLLLLQKTLINIEGLGRDLYPELNLWITAKPFLERWMREHVGLKTIWKRFKTEAPFMSEYFPQIPTLLITALEKATQPCAVLPPPQKKSKWSYLTGLGGMSLLLILAFDSWGLLNLSAHEMIQSHAVALSVLGCLGLSQGFQSSGSR